MLGVSRGKMPSPSNKQDELHNMWLMTSETAAREGRDAIRSVNLPHPCMCLVVVYSPSCLSEPLLEADFWLVFFGAAILLKAVTSAGARASASAGARALASAGARASASKAASIGDACDTVRARVPISVSARAVVTASSARDAAFGCDPVSIISFRSASSTGSIRSWLAACPELVVMMISFHFPWE